MHLVARIATVAVTTAAAATTLAAPALASSAQPSEKASCQGQVNGYYNRTYTGGGQATAAYVHENGGQAYSQAVVLGAQSHDCNVPEGVPPLPGATQK